MAVITSGAGSGASALHGILLSFPIALFTGAVVTDIAYLNTAEMQWTNFSSWLIAGGLAFGALVVVWALVDAGLARKTGGLRGALVYPGVLAIMWILGLFNAFQHSRDAWSSVGALGLTLSILSALLALFAGWLLHARPVVVREAL